MKTTRGAALCLRGLPLVLLLCAAAGARAQYAYDIVSLGNIIPYGLNNLGQVVGGYFYSRQFQQ